MCLIENIERNNLKYERQINGALRNHSFDIVYFHNVSRRNIGKIGKKSR